MPYQSVTVWTRDQISFIFHFQIMCITLSLSGGQSALPWILILHLSSEDGSSFFTSPEVATCHWQLISENPGKLALKLIRRTRKIWKRAASAPIVPLKAALRVTLCQAVGPVARGGLSGILIGLALSVISGGALYGKTGLCAIDTIIERKNRTSAEIHTAYRDHGSSPQPVSASSSS